ncbi:DUF2255 family protein [bacterium]|nr:DUF2255 family protein [bacterium]
MPEKFNREILSAIHDAKLIHIRAGTEPHRFIGIWAVAVRGRVFVRSWSIKPRSWYRTFLKEPTGAIQIANQEIAIRALRTRGEKLKDEIDQAYLKKYNTNGWIKYAQDLGREKSRATTTELVPQ